MAVLDVVIADHERSVRRGGRPRWARVGARLAPPATVTLAYLVMGWVRRWTVDDAYINFRVVKQIEAGNGPVFNVGERVEASTSTLWLALLTVADVLTPVRIEWLAVLMGLTLGAAGMAAGMAGALRLHRLLGPTGPDRIVVPLGAVAYLGVTATWDWATGGLENGLALGWLGATFWAVVVLVGTPSPSRRRLLATAALAGLGVLVRPDFAPFCAGLLVPVGWVAWRQACARALLLVGLAAVALPAAVQVFRMGYYGQLFPNTFYAKEATSSWWGQGWEYVVNFAVPYALVVPVTLTLAWLAMSWTGRGVPSRLATGSAGDPGAGDAAVAGMSTGNGAGSDHGPEGEGGSASQPEVTAWRLVVVALLVAALLHTVGIVRVGGDYMHGRLLHPTWFALLLPIMAVPVRELRSPLRVACAVALVGWAGIAAVALRPPLGNLLNHELDGLAPRSLAGGQRGHQSGVVDGRALTELQYLSGNMVRVEGSVAYGGGHALHAAADQAGPGYQLADGSTVPARPGIDQVVAGVPAIGAYGYAAPLDVWIYDRHGLADLTVGRIQLEERGTPGHEKMVGGAWIAAQFVDPAVELDPVTFGAPGATVLLLGVSIPPEDAASFASHRAAAEQALSCGDLAELLDNARAPLTPRRFLGNMVDAVRLHGFRYPVDPEQAEAQLCGRG